MRKKIFYIIVPLLVLAAACKKKDYPQNQTVGTTDFYANLMVNGNAVNMEAGKNRYYMYSAYQLDTSNVYDFIGDLKQKDCASGCAPSLRIQINNYEITSGNATFKIDSAIMVKTYPVHTGINSPGIYVSFRDTFNKSKSSVLWDFGDGTTASVNNPIHLYNAGIYKVSLKITSDNGCQSTIINTISVKGAGDLNSWIASSASARQVAFNPIVSGGKGPYTYQWDFGDDSSSTAQYPFHTYGIAGSYDVRLLVKDQNGNTSETFYNAVTGNDNSSCAANFSFSSYIASPDFLGLSKTYITYTDEYGVTYTSDNSSQPNTSSLQILSVEDYARNENNQSVKKVKLKFNCTLYNGSKSLVVQGTDVVVGMAYK